MSIGTILLIVLDTDPRRQSCPRGRTLAAGATVPAASSASLS